MSKLIAIAIATFAGLVVAAAAATPAAAQQVTRVACSSQNYQPTACPIANFTGARLVATMGGSCVEGRGWRQTRRGIEVSNGCRAVFDVTTQLAGGYPGGGFPGGGYPGQGASQVTCESLNYRPQRCAMNTRGGVQLIRIIGGSPCRQGQTWGYERGAVWVNGGCRAQFASTGNGGGYPGPNPGNPGGYTIECSSRNYQPARCPANIQTGVELVAVLGGTCIEGRSWRQGRRAIQVSDGCRARFRVY